jgi:hypothetical protein
METLDQKTERNCRVQARYDELMREGKHGHYETVFRVVREEVEAEREQQAAQIEAMRAALEWYADEARSCEKNSKVGNYYAGDAILASVTVLALDGGKRADAALRQEQPT